MCRGEIGIDTLLKCKWGLLWVLCTALDVNCLDILITIMRPVKVVRPKAVSLVPQSVLVGGLQTHLAAVAQTADVWIASAQL